MPTHGRRNPNETPLQKRVMAFVHAWRGLVVLVRTQPHARFHLLATVAVIGLGLAAGLAAGEWALLVLAIGLVWVAEALNTALEFLADEVSEEWRERLGRAKDVAAAAVLLSAVAALAVGACVFGPRLAGGW
jgi:diacylglycerol kinase (ATP)